MAAGSQESYYLLCFSFDGYFDHLAKLKLREQPTGLCKFKNEDVFAVATQFDIMIYCIENRNFFRLFTISQLDPVGIKSMAILQQTSDLIVLCRSNPKLVMVKK